MSKVDEEIFFKSYEKFSNLLRTWLVAYGIGSIVFLSSNQTVSKALQGSPISKSIVTFFLVGIGLQVLSAILYKYTMGFLYHAERFKEQQKWFRYKCAVFISKSFLLESVMDFITICVYINATYLVASIVVT